MSILWLPGKSPALRQPDSKLRDPAVNYGNAFDSMSTFNAERPKKSGTIWTVEVELIQEEEGQRLGLFGHFRR